MAPARKPELHHTLLKLEQNNLIASEGLLLMSSKPLHVSHDNASVNSHGHRAGTGDKVPQAIASCAHFSLTKNILATTGPTQLPCTE